MQPPSARLLLPNTYLTYPHGNGFCDDGKRVVLGVVEEGICRLVAFDLNGGDAQELCRFDTPGGEKDAVYFDVAPAPGVLIAVWGNRVWRLKLENPGSPEEVYAAAAGTRLQGLCSITADGSRALVGESGEDSHAAVCVDLHEGGARTLFAHSWHANHFHFCPHDETWVGYSHEGLTETIPDRVWAWHPEKAPQGRCVFDQRSDNPETPLCVGHERWAFHDTCALAVAYGVSPYGPRGLYEVFADERPPRLISGADRDWHCDVSRDGRLAVVDTTGPYDRPGHGWDKADGISDIVLVCMRSGSRRFLARTSFSHHPHHPHPVFSPDGRYVLFNHSARQEGDAPWGVMLVEVPEITG